MSSALETDDPAGPAAPPERLLRLDARHLAAAGLVAVISFGQAWFRWIDWRKGFGDIAVIDQVAWKLAHGKEPIISGLGWNAFADHLAPIYVLFGGLYRVHETVAWVFAAEAVAFGVCVLALPALLDALGVEGRAKTMFQVAFVLNPLMWNAAAFAGHTTTMAVPVLIIGLTAALRGRVGLTALSVAALLLFRDDLGLAAAAIAFIGLAHDRERRPTRWAAIAGLALAWETFGGALALHMGVDRLWLQRFSYLGTGPVDALLHPLHSVPELVGQVTAGAPLTQVVFWLATVAFLPLLAPKRLLVVLVVGLPILAANDSTVQSVHFHHGAVLVPFLIWAAAGGLARWRTLADRDFPALALPAMAAVLLVLSGPVAAGHFDRSPVTRRVGDQILASLPSADRVVASPDLAMHLGERETLLVAPYPFADDCRALPRVKGVRNFAISATDAVDTIVLLEPRSAQEKTELEALVGSRCFADLGQPDHIGNVLVYRRVAG